MVVLLIKAVPVSNLLDDDDVIDYSKLHSEIPGSQAILPGKISSQRLGSAHVWPFLQSFQQVIHPRPNRRGKPLKLFSGSCSESDHRSIMTVYDKKVKFLWQRSSATGVSVR
jgi:hypothetical protein